MVVAMVLAAAIAISIGVRVRPQAVTIPGSHVQFDQPSSWQSDDPARYLDPAWARDLKARYPADAAFIDATVEGFRSGAFDYSVWIDLNGDGRGRQSSVDAAVTERPAAPLDLKEEALRSLDVPPAIALPGATAADVSPPGGPPVRLDWRFQLHRADATVEDAAVRTYWIADGGEVTAIQLTNYGDHPEELASFEAAMATLRWRAPSGS